MNELHGDFELENIAVN